MDTNNCHVALVASRFNEYVTQGLVDGALKIFNQQKIDEKLIDTFWVPGALELPLISKKLIQTQKYQAIIALGCVVKGDTAHFEIVANQSCQQLTQLSIDYEIPILLSVLTTYTMDQAIARSSNDDHNKGAQCAQAALEMITLMRQI